MMRCQTAKSLIPSLIDGELDEAKRAEVRRHARRCAECAGEIKFYAELTEAARNDPMPAPPPVYFESVLAEVHRAMPARPSVRPRARRRWTRQAGAHAAVAALFLVWVAAGVGPLLKARWGDADGAGSMRARAPMFVAAADVAAFRALVAVPGLGLVSPDSQILKLTPAQLRELGLIGAAERRAGRKA